MARVLWFVVGLGAVAVGLGIALIPSSGPASFGWFAYGPSDVTLPSATYHESFILITRHVLIGWTVGALGLLVIAAGLGYVAGRRRSRRWEAGRVS